MKLILVTLLLSSTLFSMNSTQNRWVLADVDHMEYVVFELHKAAFKGDLISAMAYECYVDLASNSFPRHINNTEVQQKLVTLGLCILKDETLKLKEFYLDDTLPALESLSQKDKTCRAQKKTK